jgi:hypothetical protein
VSAASLAFRASTSRSMAGDAHLQRLPGIRRQLWGRQTTADYITMGVDFIAW